MDDLAEIKNLRPNAPLPDTADLAGARDLLVAAFEGSRPTTRETTRWYRRRATWLTAGAGVAASAITVALLTPTSQPAQPAGSDRPIQVLTAAQILHNAAAQALSEPDVIPRPDQFVYAREDDGQLFWGSVDGTHDGLAINLAGHRSIVYGCVNGQEPVLDKEDRPTGRTEACTPMPAYDPNLSTDPNVLMRQLNNGPYNPNNPADVNRVGKGAWVLEGHYMRPAVRAALFNAFATIPGLRVDRSVTDGIGRHGIGIGWSFEGGSAELVFDPKTYVFLVGTTVGIHGEKGWASIVQLAIVDKAGEVPAS